jgi:hypothetical protein
MTMNEFRSRQPLNDDDFAAIRRNVMTTIAKRNERRFLPIVMRFALAAAVVIAIGVALVAYRRTGSVESGVGSGRTETQAISHIPLSHTPHPTPDTRAVVASVAVPPQFTPVTHRPRRHRTPHIELAKQNIRVEFRTSDPDVRIIWIASQTPNTTTGGKS